MMKPKNTPINTAILCTNGLYDRVPHISYLENYILENIDKPFRLIVSMPPRHGKSEFLSKHLPHWFLENKENYRIILTTYESSFAEYWCENIRNLILEYGSHWNNTLLKNTQKHIQLSNKSELYAVGAMSSLTGKGADLILIDDPVKNAEEAFSKVYREKLWNWYISTLLTRLEPQGKVIILMTRWHEDDLVGRLLKSKTNYDYIRIPAIAEDNDLLGRQIGEALWNTRYNIHELNNIKNNTDITSYWFNAMYQQKPINEGSEIVSRNDWQLFDYSIDFDFKNILVSWDTAFKTKEQNDYSVGTVWGFKDNNYYLIDAYRQKLEFTELKSLIKSIHSNYKSFVTIIEDKASGQSLLQVLASDGDINIDPINPGQRDKTLRLHLVTPLFKNKRVFINQNIAIKEDILDEIAEFPHGLHDDIVDSITQALERIRDYYM